MDMRSKDTCEGTESSQHKWIKKLSRSKPGLCYYINLKTNQSVWKLPVGGVVVEDATASAPPKRTTKFDCPASSKKSRTCDVSENASSSSKPCASQQTDLTNNSSKKRKKRRPPSSNNGGEVKNCGYEGGPSLLPTTSKAIVASSTNENNSESNAPQEEKRKKKRPRKRKKPSSNPSETAPPDGGDRPTKGVPSSNNMPGPVDADSQMVGRVVKDKMTHRNLNQNIAAPPSHAEKTGTTRSKSSQNVCTNTAVRKESSHALRKLHPSSKVIQRPAEARLNNLRAQLVSGEVSKSNATCQAAGTVPSVTGVKCREVSTDPKVLRREPLNLHHKANFQPAAQRLAKLKGQLQTNKMLQVIMQKGNVSTQPTANLLPSVQRVAESQCQQKKSYRAQENMQKGTAPPQPVANLSAAQRLAQLQSMLRANQKDQERMQTGVELSMKSSADAQTLLPSRPTDTDDSMEVEYLESDVLCDITEMRQNDNGPQLTESTIFMDVDIECPVISSAVEPVLHVVLDTNILLSHLKLVERLLDTYTSEKEIIHLFIPWQVLQELDHLKDKGKTSIQPLARHAIKFLHTNFSNKHPRMRGQKLNAAASCKGCPDDSILQSCLQLKEQGCNVILLSNDINLLNKALICDVEAVSKDQFSKQVVKDSGNRNIFQKDTKEILEDVQHSNAIYDIYCFYKNICLEALSKIVSRGMEDQYKDLWKKRLVRPPPWEAHDVLHCLSKHWLPVCGDLMPGFLKPITIKLEDLLKVCGKGNSVSVAGIKEIFELTLSLFDAIPQKYNEIISVAAENIKALNLKLVGSPFGEQTEMVQKPEDPLEYRHTLVLRCFEEAHNSAISLCNSDPTSDPDWTQKAQCMVQAVGSLLLLLRVILSAHPESLNENHPGISELLSLIKGNSNISKEDLVNFCKQETNRVLLENGVQQFQSIGLQLSHKLQV